MKKLLIIAIASAMVAGCGPAIEPEQAPNGSLKGTSYGTVKTGQYYTFYTKVSIEGHDYITVRGAECVAMVHAESCPCKISK